MERRVADILNAATSRFYAQQSQSFSQTRQSAWPGWERCLPYLDELAAVGKTASSNAAPGAEADDAVSGAGACSTAFGHTERCGAASKGGAVVGPLSLVDVGCGNLRFEAFLKAARPNFAVDITAVDYGSALFDQARPGIFGNAQAGEVCNNEACNGDVQNAEVRNGEARARAGNDEKRAGGVRDSGPCAGGMCTGGMRVCEERSAEPPDVLASGIHLASFQNLDLVTQALDREPLLGVRLNGQADAVLCFGFMHHMPGHETRVFALREMLRLLRPGGLLIVSFWQFMKSPKLAAQAESLHEQAISDLELAAADLEAGDHLLGWQRVPGVYRYCHSFSEAELDSLPVELSDLAELEERFEADGRTGNLNTYVILRRK